eukprot:3934411-Rhodomonas_salina.1
MHLRLTSTTLSNTASLSGSKFRLSRILLYRVFGVLEALITDCEVVSTKNAVGLYQNSSSGFSIVVVDENPPAEFERRAKLVGLQGQVCPDGDFHRSDPSGRIQRFEALYSKWESLEAQCGILHMQNDDEVLIQGLVSVQDYPLQDICKPLSHRNSTTMLALRTHTYCWTAHLGKRQSTEIVLYASETDECVGPCVVKDLKTWVELSVSPDDGIVEVGDTVTFTLLVLRGAEEAKAEFFEATATPVDASSTSSGDVNNFVLYNDLEEKLVVDSQALGTAELNKNRTTLTVTIAKSPISSPHVHVGFKIWVKVGTDAQSRRTQELKT